jgi:hypothetical protein
VEEMKMSRRRRTVEHGLFVVVVVVFLCKTAATTTKTSSERAINETSEISNKTPSVITTADEKPINSSSSFSFFLSSY